MKRQHFRQGTQSIADHKVDYKEVNEATLLIQTWKILWRGKGGQQFGTAEESCFDLTSAE